jgi:hypothetical protein
MRVPSVVAVSAASAICALAAGCGSADTTPSPASGTCDATVASAVRHAEKVFIGWPDVTDSTHESRDSYLPDMETFAGMAAHSHAPLLMDAFTGAPENTTDWPVRCDFSKTPEAFAGNGDLQQAYADKQVTELRPQMRALLEKPAEQSGSPLLNVLVESSYTMSSHPGVTACIAVFTDAGVFQAGFRAGERMTEEQVDQLIDTWAPRMSALRGATVLITGVGRGTDITVDQLEYVRTVISRLLTRVGARLGAFDTRMSGNERC